MHGERGHYEINSEGASASSLEAIFVQGFFFALLWFGKVSAKH
jgi:hypothetical protein